MWYVRCCHRNNFSFLSLFVAAVICPAFVLMDEYEDAFYRSTPEGELRIMGTTAEFVCEEGHRVTAQCLANGQWSRGLPLDKECTLKSMTYI